MPSTLSPQIVLQTNELQTQLEHSKVLPVFVGSEQAFAQAHIPGSVHMVPRQLVCGIPPAAGKLPEQDDLSALFSSIGLTPDTIVIAYDDEGGGWAGRLIWTLDIIGHSNYHFLDGGINAWLADDLPCSQGTTTIKASHYSASIKQSLLVPYQDIVQQLGQQNFAIWDARSPEEHSGEKVMAARGGRMPGAANLNWLELMDRSNALRLKPLATIRAILEQRGIDASKNIVTHCQAHHRSGLTYLVGKVLGLNIKAYDGAWSEWGNLTDTPIENSHSQ